MAWRDQRVWLRTAGSFCRTTTLRVSHASSRRPRNFSMLRIITALLLLAASVAVAGESRLNEPTGALTLRQALALALSRSPELAAFDYDIRIAEARILQAKSTPNPEADFTGESVAGTDAYSNADQSENTLLLSQLIELGGKRRARVREAGFGRELAGFDYEIRKREVFSKDGRAFRRSARGPAPGRAGRGTRAVGERVRAGGRETGGSRESIEPGENALRHGARLRPGSIWKKRDAMCLPGGSGSPRSGGRARPRFASVAGDLDATPATASLDILARRLAANPRLARFGAEVAQREAALAREKAAVVPDVTLRAGASADQRNRRRNGRRRLFASAPALESQSKETSAPRGSRLAARARSRPRLRPRS